MLFRKGRKRSGAQHQTGGDNRDVQDNSGLCRIDFDMMVKGNFAKRKGQEVRQCGVTVRGSTRLVTSGDVVDRETYEALIASGNIRPAPPARPSEPASIGDNPPAKPLEPDATPKVDGAEE